MPTPQFSPAFVIDRLTLVAGQRTEVSASRPAKVVVIGNETADILRIYSSRNDSDATPHYLELEPGYERDIRAEAGSFGTMPRASASVPDLWLESNVDGLVTLVWS